MGCNLENEEALHEEGYGRIAGIDEAGRGPLAGPVVAAAVILPQDYTLDQLNDSKKLSPSVREELYESITTNKKIIWSSARVEPDEIDRINILQATYKAMARAMEGLAKKPDLALIDGKPVPNFPIEHRALVGGDGLSLSIAAASIIAKVERDRFMLEMAAKYPQYGFESHKGYGTKAHLANLQKHGPCPIHRRSFRPVSQLTFDFD